MGGSLWGYINLLWKCYWGVEENHNIAIPLICNTFTTVYIIKLNQWSLYVGFWEITGSHQPLELVIMATTTMIMLIIVVSRYRTIVIMQADLLIFIFHPDIVESQETRFFHFSCTRSIATLVIGWVNVNNFCLIRCVWKFPPRFAPMWWRVVRLARRYWPRCWSKEWSPWWHNSTSGPLAFT